MFFAGLEEAELLTGRSGLGHRELAQEISDLGPAEVILKLGPDGAFALDRAEALQQEAIRVDVVDTVGAGDAFAAGYLAEWLRGLPAEARLATAVRTGAAACLHHGDWEGASTRAGLDQFEKVDELVLR